MPNKEPQQDQNNDGQSEKKSYAEMATSPEQRAAAERQRIIQIQETAAQQRHVELLNSIKLLHKLHTSRISLSRAHKLSYYEDEEDSFWKKSVIELSNPTSTLRQNLDELSLNVAQYSFENLTEVAFYLADAGILHQNLINAIVHRFLQLSSSPTMPLSIETAACFANLFATQRVECSTTIKRMFQYCANVLLHHHKKEDSVEDAISTFNRMMWGLTTIAVYLEHNPSGTAMVSLPEIKQFLAGLKIFLEQHHNAVLQGSRDKVKSCNQFINRVRNLFVLLDFNPQHGSKEFQYRTSSSWKIYFKSFNEKSHVPCADAHSFESGVFKHLRAALDLTKEVVPGRIYSSANGNISIKREALIGPYSVDFLIERNGKTCSIEADGAVFHHTLYISNGEICSDHLNGETAAKRRFLSNHCDHVLNFSIGIFEQIRQENFRKYEGSNISEAHRKHKTNIKTLEAVIKILPREFFQTAPHISFQPELTLCACSQQYLAFEKERARDIANMHRMQLVLQEDQVDAEKELIRQQEQTQPQRVQTATDALHTKILAFEGDKPGDFHEIFNWILGWIQLGHDKWYIGALKFYDDLDHKAAISLLEKAQMSYQTAAIAYQPLLKQYPETEIIYEFNKTIDTWLKKTNTLLQHVKEQHVIDRVETEKKALKEQALMRQTEEQDKKRLQEEYRLNEQRLKAVATQVQENDIEKEALKKRISHLKAKSFQFRIDGAGRLFSGTYRTALKDLYAARDLIYQAFLLQNQLLQQHTTTEVDLAADKSIKASMMAVQALIDKGRDMYPGKWKLQRKINLKQEALQREQIEKQKKLQQATRPPSISNLSEFPELGDISKAKPLCFSHNPGSVPKDTLKSMPKSHSNLYQTVSVWTAKQSLSPSIPVCSTAETEFPELGGASHAKPTLCFAANSRPTAKSHTIAEGFIPREPGPVPTIALDPNTPVPKSHTHNCEPVPRPDCEPVPGPADCEPVPRPTIANRSHDLTRPADCEPVPRPALYIMQKKCKPTRFNIHAAEFRPEWDLAPPASASESSLTPDPKPKA